MKNNIVEGYDGTRLIYSEKYNPSSQVGILLLHGLAEHKGRYDDFINRLIKFNFSVFAIDLRGHGESLGRRGDITDFSIYQSDVHCLVCKIKKNYPHLKLAILGHSLGGLIATAYVSTHDIVDFLILSNPLIVSPKRTIIFRFLPYKMLGFIKVKKRYSESLEMLEYSYADPLATNYFTIRLLGVIFHQGINYVNASLSNVTLPTLLMTGELDPLISSASLQKVLDRFGSKDKQMRIYKNVKHRLFQSKYKEAITEELVDWLNERL